MPALRHWQATRAAIRAKLDTLLITAGARPEEKDALAASLTTIAIDAYNESIQSTYGGLPRSPTHTGPTP